jgi:glycosyltransferase involved in cell wall biosynthesis
MEIIKNKIVFISNMAAPYQIENCKYLNENTKNEYYFLFCVNREDNRPSYWDEIPFKPLNTKTLKKPFFITKNLFINFDIISELKVINPDIVIIGGYNLLTGIYASMWAKWNKKKTILYTEKFLPSSLGKGIIKYLLFRMISKLYDKFMLVGTDGYKEHKYLIDKKNIPYLINIERYYITNKEYFQNKKINFLYSGRFSTNQNTLIIVKVFLDLCKEYSNIKLILSGNGEDLIKIQEIIKKSNYSTQIEIDNSYKSWFELPNLYQRADVLLAPLAHSGWGFVIEEAMASSLAIISTYETGSAAEYIIDNYNGFMINPNNKELKEAMIKYIDNQKDIVLHGKRNFQIKKDVSYKYMINRFDTYVTKS